MTRFIWSRLANTCRFSRMLERLGLMQLTKIRGGFIPGDRRRTMSVPGAPSMLPLVCYEIIFPGEACRAGARRGGCSI